MRTSYLSEGPVLLTDTTVKTVFTTPAPMVAYTGSVIPARSKIPVE